ncbi:MAG: type II and III secretion system protein family protein [Propylenella sp.]
MTVLGPIRAILVTIMLAAIALPGAAAAQGYLKLGAGEMLDGRPVNLGVNKSVVLDLPRPVGDVLVSNPQIADAVLRTSTRLYLIGVDFGQASVFLFDDKGEQIGNFDVYVAADVTGLNQLLAEAIPNGYVRADAINKSIVLRGQVQTASEASRAVEIATKMLPQIITSTTSGNSTGAQTTFTQTAVSDASQPGIVNLIAIAGEEQVALKVTVAEVQREVAKQLGINMKGLLLDGGFGIGTNLPGFGTIAGFAAAGAGGSPLRFPFNSARTPAEVGVGYEEGTNAVQGTLQALEETQMLRTLAEPILTAVSGETANFLAGGEFPVPVAGDDGQITIQFKPFGVNLAFTPVVLSAGRIALKVRTEVSDISATGAVSVPITSNAVVTIPATSVRRAETSIELPSGGAFVIAGLLQEDVRRAVSGFPWLQKLPILGTLFSSKDFLNRQTELVMIVTAYLVKPAAPQDLSRPGENLYMANDAEAYFLNRLTKVYGTTGQAPAGASASVGFTFD